MILVVNSRQTAAARRAPGRIIKLPAIVSALIMGLLLIAGCSFFEPSLEATEGQIMGTSYHVKWSDESIGAAPEEISAGILEALQQIDVLMSTYKQDSELSRFNRSEPGVWFPISGDTLAVMKIAAEVGENSSGAFDVTVGALVNLWGFGPQYKPTQVPSEFDIGQAKAAIGRDKLEIDAGNSRIRKSTQLYVDLSAVAKGYAVDKVADYLDSMNAKAYMVEVGGEIRTKGVKPDGSKWRIAVESPVVGQRKVQDVLELHDMGMATSGDYRNFYEENGIRYSHTIDPRTGRPIHHRLASVTVLHPSSGVADAWATAFMVLGEEQGRNVAVENNIAALFIYKDGDKFIEQSSPRFDEILGRTGEL